MDKIGSIAFFLSISTFAYGQSNCGNQTFKPHSHQGTTAKIVGGRIAVPHSWPWQVELRFRSNPLTCGGALIRTTSGEIVVMTAAQCVDGTIAADWQVDTGVHSRSALEDYQKTYQVSSFSVHQNYSAYYLENDIAIMRLTPAVVENDATSPICITTSPTSDFWGKDCVVTGWGATTEGGSPSDQLKEVYKPVLSDADCLTNIGGAFHAPTMTCAGYIAGGQGACAGDQGGPLACKNSAGLWDLVGIVSWGFGCAREGFPAVYADVHKLRNWIISETSSTG